MTRAELRLVPPTTKRAGWRSRVPELRAPGTWNLYDLLIPGLGGVWVWWVTQELVGPLVVALLLLLVCLVKPKGGGPRG